MARTGQLIAALLATFFIAICIPAAHATVYPDQGSAYAACQAGGAAAASNPNLFPSGDHRCEGGGNPDTGGSYQCYYQARVFGPDSPYLDYLDCGVYNFPANTSCASHPSFTSTFLPKSGSLSCNDGCLAAWFQNPDGTSTAEYTGNTCDPHDLKCGDGYLWNPVLNVCQPTKDECPSGQKPNSLGKCAPQPCPDGMIQQQDGTCKPKENECPQGEVKGPDGSCVKKPDVCGAGKAMGSDGTCKDDKDGDGKPDDEEGGDDKDKNKDDNKDDPSFSGGDSCDAPPACSGDAILCGQASIQWRIDCNTRRNVNIAGGACSTPPICTGDKCDAMEYASLLMQWRTACAAEKLAAGGDSKNSSGQPDWTKVDGMSQDPGAGATAQDTQVLTVNKVSTDSLDSSGFGGGSCVGFAGAGVGVVSNAISSTFASPPPMWCDYMAKFKAGMIVVASCVAAMILARGAGG